MSRNTNLAQDVWKDAGQNVSFTTFELNRKNHEEELDQLRDFIDSYQAIGRSLRIRSADSNLRMSLGFSRAAWDYLFPDAPIPKELVTFTGLKGKTPEACMPATKGDIFLHIRSNSSAVVYEATHLCRNQIRNAATIIDSDRGFGYFEGRAIVGFIDGTEVPVGEELVESALAGEEDSIFENGSYLFAQKWVHDMDKWESLTTEDQEKAIGRRKFNDLELKDSEKFKNAHNVSSKFIVDGEEKKIVRMNVPYTDTHTGAIGTYFMGYSSSWYVTFGMMQNMIDQNDFLLSFSKVTTGQLYFVPSTTILDAMAEGTEGF